jgi:hypothetical protein
VWYTIVNEGVPLGLVDLPSRTLAAAQVHPLPAYHTIEPTIRLATEALLHLGLFGIAAPRVSSLSLETIRQRRAFVRASRLRLELVANGGVQTATAFLNLLQAPADGGVIAVANFMAHPASVGAFVEQPPGGERGTA